MLDVNQHLIHYYIWHAYTALGLVYIEGRTEEHESFSNLIGMSDWFALDVISGGTVEGNANKVRFPI